MTGPGRRWLYQTIFEHDTAAGRGFDVVLLVLIVGSVLAVMLDSVGAIASRYGPVLLAVEWIFTLLFTVEYLLRLYCAPHPRRYATSFFGLVDLLAILPTFLSVVFPAGRFLVTVRILRVLRVFRILKLGHFLGEARVLTQALRASRHKISVFLATVLAIVVVMGSVMYLVEGPAAGFTSIPRSIYWAIVTLTTVGYGDLAPRTPLGQALASLLMITGFGIIAVPTGIVTLELGRAATAGREARACGSCDRAGHDVDAVFCRHCGARL